MAAYYKDLLKSFRLSPLHFLRGNRRLITPYILLFNLLLIVFYLRGLIMRGVNTFITVNYLNRFFNGSLSLIRVVRDFNTFFGQTLLWP